MQTKQIALTALLLLCALPAAAQPPTGQLPSGQTPAPTRAGQTPATPPAGAPVPAAPADTPIVREALPPLPANAPTVDIFALMDRLAREMNKEFIIDPRMRGMVGLSTARDEADYDTLLALLRANGYATIEVGDEIRIVPEAVARSEPSPVLFQDDPRISDHAVVTRVIDAADVEYTLPDGTTANGSAQLVPVLRPLLSPSIGNISTIPGTTKLIIIDRYDNVRRVTAIIDELRQ